MTEDAMTVCTKKYAIVGFDGMQAQLGQCTRTSHLGCYEMHCPLRDKWVHSLELRLKDSIYDRRYERRNDRHNKT
jgi:hypothetical protein